MRQRGAMPSAQGCWHCQSAELWHVLWDVGIPPGTCGHCNWCSLPNWIQLQLSLPAWQTQGAVWCRSETLRTIRRLKQAFPQNILISNEVPLSMVEVFISFFGNLYVQGPTWSACTVIYTGLMSWKGHFQLFFQVTVIRRSSWGLEDNKCHSYLQE